MRTRLISGRIHFGMACDDTGGLENERERNGPNEAYQLLTERLDVEETALVQGDHRPASLDLYTMQIFQHLHTVGEE